MIQNKRRAPRYPIGAVEFDCRKASWSFLRSNIAQRVVDLSSGGARVVCTEALAPGDRVRLELSFPGKEVSVRTAARVVWGRTQEHRKGRTHHLGVAFDADLSDLIDRLTMTRSRYLTTRVKRAR